MPGGRKGFLTTKFGRVGLLVTSVALGDDELLPEFCGNRFTFGRFTFGRFNADTQTGNETIFAFTKCDTLKFMYNLFTKA